MNAPIPRTRRHTPPHVAALPDIAQRSTLPRRDARYWVRLDYGLFLGYRNQTGKPTWQARGRTVDRRYRYEILGYADDLDEADGNIVLSFAQASEAARQWFRSLADQRMVAPDVRLMTIPLPVDGETFTVGHAVAGYLTWYRDNRRGARSVFHGFKTHILPQLGTIPVAELTTGQISDWFDALSVAPRLMRAKSHLPAKFGAPPRSPDEFRARRNNANRLLTFLKAALNHAFYSGKVDDDLAWRRVRKHRNVDKPRTRYLQREECQRLLAAAPADLRDLIAAGLLTGCRPSELTSLRVCDFLPQVGRLYLEKTKTGRPRTVALNGDGEALFARLTKCRDPEEPLLVRGDGTTWSNYFSKAFKATCAEAGIVPSANFYVLRHTYATHAVLNGVPLIVVARQLGHSTTRMVEKHYGHIAQDFVDAHIKASMPSLAVLGPVR